MYLDSNKHSAATGGAARMSRKPGGTFAAWDGQLSGKNLLIVKNRMIVQAWRSTQWKASDLDSTLILIFSKAPGGGQVNITHVNVPEHDHDGVMKGWRKYYWEPWKKYLQARRK
jgi:activator of HSP90 ATPase